MKIAFTTSGNDLSSLLDNRFGRAPLFLVYDLDNESYKLFDNLQSQNTVQGAGVQSAEAITRLGVQALVSGNCGPKAFSVLSAAGIKIFTAENLTIAEALAQYRTGKLPELKSDDVEGH